VFYFLYKLKFKTPLHVGNDSGSAGLVSSGITVHSDTLMSALYIESIRIKREDELFSAYESGKIAVSSLFPYCGDELFLPKPVYAYKADVTTSSSENYKLYKKLQYIPLSMFEEYLASLNGEGTFDAEKAQELMKGVARVDTRARVKVNYPDDNEPYYVGTTTFADSCGLYFITGYESEDEKNLFETLLGQLSYGGIGGKRSSGLGKFEVIGKIRLTEEVSEPYKTLYKMLCGNYHVFMSINVSLAKDDELDAATDGGYYVLLRRGGFVGSEEYSDTPLKKKLMYAFGEGSCIKTPYKGYIADVSQGGNHPVYRFLKPLFVGVEL